MKADLAVLELTLVIHKTMAPLGYLHLGCYLSEFEFELKTTGNPWCVICALYCVLV